VRPEARHGELTRLREMNEKLVTVFLLARFC